MIQRIITIITSLILTTAVSHSQQLQLFTNVQGMSQVYDLAFDNEGNVYAAGIASGNAAVVKLDSTGNEIWRNDLVVAMMSNRIAIAQEVFVNDSGQVFVSCSREVGKGTVARLDKNDGSIVWRYDGVRGYSSTNSQVLNFSRITASNTKVLFAIGAKTSDQNQKTHIYIFNNETGTLIQNSRLSAKIITGYGTLVFDSILYGQSFDNSDSTLNNRIYSISTSGKEVFLSIEEQLSLLNLIGLHNNKFYGIRNDDNPDGPGSSPTLVQIDSVTGNIISEKSFRTSVDTVTKGGVGLSEMTDEYGILVSGAASSYPGFSRAYKWIAQVHPQTAEVVWDTLIAFGNFGYDHIFSSGERHFLTGRANTIHELTVPKIGWTPSSTESVTEKKKSKIYPNPASNVLHLEIHNPRSKVMIYTIEGKLMKETRGDQKQLDISGYPSGMYFVSIIEPSDAIETFKIVKK